MCVCVCVGRWVERHTLIGNGRGNGKGSHGKENNNDGKVHFEINSRIIRMVIVLS